MTRAFLYMIVLLVTLPSMVSGSEMGGQEILKKADDVLFPDECSYTLKVRASIQTEDIELEFDLQAYQRGDTNATIVWTSPAVQKGDVGLRSGEKIYYKPKAARKPQIMNYKAVFVDSASSWGDILSVKLSNDYTAESMEKVTEEGTELYHLVLKPKRNELYAKIGVWINALNFQTFKRVFYSPTDSVLKVARYENYTLSHNTVTCFEVHVENIQYGINGISYVSGIKHEKLPPFLFDPSNIGRIHAP
jgi:hypothetical protein